jgi:hypothetical protein
MVNTLIPQLSSGSSSGSSRDEIGWYKAVRGGLIAA